MIPPARWALALAFSTACACSQAAELRLRLERSLSPVEPVAADARTHRLVSFGVSDIRGRITRLHERTEAMRQQNDVLNQQVARADALMGRLHDLSASQGQALDGLDEAAVLVGQGEALHTRVGPEAPARVQDAIGARSREPVNAQGPTPAAGSERPRAPRQASDSTLLPAPLSSAPHGDSLPWAAAAAVAVVVRGLLVWGALRFRQAGVNVGRPGRSRRAPPAVAHVPRARVSAMPEPAPVSAVGSSNTGAVMRATVTELRAVQARKAAAVPSPGAWAQDAMSSMRDEETPTPAACSNDGPASAAAGQEQGAAPVHRVADEQVLKEVDTLIAFEQYDKARELLEAMMAADADNPELLMRHYHVRTHGGAETASDDAALLQAMMEGPLSDTMKRVREIGQSLMPGDPLFKDQEERDAAMEVLGRSGKITLEGPAQRSEAMDEEFLRTVKMDVPPRFLSGRDAAG